MPRETRTTAAFLRKLLALSAGLSNKNKDKNALVITCCQENHLRSKELIHQYV